MQNQWTDQDLNQLKTLVANHSNREIAQILGKTYEMVKNKITVLKIRRTKEQRAILRRKTATRFTELEDRIIRDNYLLLPYPKIAQILGKTTSSVEQRARRMGLRLPDYLKAQRAEIGQFKKGQNAWNKGMEGIRVSPATEFKKGNLPANTVKEGEIVKRWHSREQVHYLLYKPFGARKLVYYHRYLYEQAYGEIPKSHIIIFKDGDTTNCHLDNIACISRQENALRNKNQEKASQSFRQTLGRGEVNLSDACVANMLTFHIKNQDVRLATREALAKHPEYIALERERIRLKRIINYQTKQKNARNHPPQSK